ncbi:MAG: hypothetical protein ACLR6B_08680 [Blautia sp.]
MIASIKEGYLLEGAQSGMEDPKHWGIQCMVSMGREIKRRNAYRKSSRSADTYRLCAGSFEEYHHAF